MLSAVSARREITLDHPIEHHGVVYRTLTVRPPTAADQTQAARGKFSKFGKGLALFSLVCGVPKEVIRNLEMIDAMKIEAFLLPYLGG